MRRWHDAPPRPEPWDYGDSCRAIPTARHTCVPVYHQRHTCVCRQSICGRALATQIPKSATRQRPSPRSSCNFSRSRCSCPTDHDGAWRVCHVHAGKPTENRHWRHGGSSTEGLGLSAAAMTTMLLVHQPGWEEDPSDLFFASHMLPANHRCKSVRVPPGQMIS